MARGSAGIKRRSRTCSPRVRGRFRICSRGRIRQFDVPVESPVIPVYQFWHTLFHKDEANQWLRSILHSLFSTGPREAGR